MKNFDEILKQAQAVQAKLAEAQEKLGRLEADGVSGAGLVRVTLGGDGKMRRVAIDRSLAKPDEIEILEDLIVAAQADAVQKLEAMKAEEMRKATQGLGLPRECSAG